MIQDLHPIAQAFLGTLFTWGLTAAGAGMIVVIGGSQRKLLDISLGFAGGVMTAASYWSLLAPAIEMAEESKTYGQNGEYAFIPSVVGFLIGALFVWATDLFISSLGAHSPHLVLAFTADNVYKDKRERVGRSNEDFGELIENTTTIDGFSDGLSSSYHSRRRMASSAAPSGKSNNSMNNSNYTGLEDLHKNPRWKRIVLLIVAITVHNIPEGLAVGVGFGAIGSSATATFESARNLAIGIGLQNFPEGLAVSLPLKAAGFSTWRSFWYGQLSGMVEPIFGVLGAAAVTLSQPILPYALAFAAGAMIYVVVDDIVPEGNSSGNGKLATWGFIWGFIIMMVLDVGLG